MALAKGNGSYLRQETLRFSSVVALTEDRDPQTVVASGVLISPDVVLSAGHVLDEASVACGWYNENGGGIRQFHLSGGPEREPSYGSQGPFFNDLVLFRLSAPVREEIYPIATSAEIDQRTQFRFVGYGNDANGSWGKRKTFCVNKLQGPPNGTKWYPDRELEVTDSIGGVGAICERDSGGPLLIELGEKFLLAGIVSRRNDPNQAVCGEGSLAVRLDVFATSWIDPAIKRLGGQPRPK